MPVDGRDGSWEGREIDGREEPMPVEGVPMLGRFPVLGRLGRLPVLGILGRIDGLVDGRLPVPIDGLLEGRLTEGLPVEGRLGDGRLTDGRLIDGLDGRRMEEEGRLIDGADGLLTDGREARVPMDRLPPALRPLPPNPLPMATSAELLIRVHAETITTNINRMFILIFPAEYCAKQLQNDRSTRLFNYQMRSVRRAKEVGGPSQQVHSLDGLHRR